MFVQGTIWPDLGLSSLEFVVGFGLALVVSFPLITALYATPIIMFSSRC